MKSAGSGTNSLSGAFYNHGLVNVQVGTLSFHSGGGGSGGEFRAATGAQNQFVAGTYAWDGVSFTGDGANRVVGTVTMNGTLSSVNLELAGGTSWIGTSTLSGTATWTGGQLYSGQLTLAAGAVLTVSGPADKQINFATLENLGRIVWTDAGRIVWNGAGKIINQAGATWEITGDGALADVYGSGTAVTNWGTVVKSAGSGTNSLSGAFYNHGLVDVTSGAIRLVSSVALSPSSVLSFAVGGENPASQHGLLLLNGALNLQGTIAARLVNGFVPAADQTFKVIQGGTLTGGFANTNVLVADSFWAFTPEYSANGVDLHAWLRTPTPSSLLANWDAGTFRIQLSGGAGETYRVDASTNLTDWTTLLLTNLPTSVLAFNDLSATNYPTRFYRSVAVP